MGAQQAASCVCSIRTDIIEHFRCDLVTERCISGAQQAVYQWGTAGGCISGAQQAVYQWGTAGGVLPMFYQSRHHWAPPMWLHGNSAVYMFSQKRHHWTAPIYSAVYQWGHSRRCPAYVQSEQTSLNTSDMTRQHSAVYRGGGGGGGVFQAVSCVCSIRKDHIEQHLSIVWCISGAIAGGVLRMCDQNRHH